MSNKSKIKTGAVVNYLHTSWIVTKVYKNVAVLAIPGLPMAKTHAPVAALTNVGPWK